MCGNIAAPTAKGTRLQWLQSKCQHSIKECVAPKLAKGSELRRRPKALTVVGTCRRRSWELRITFAQAAHSSNKSRHNWRECMLGIFAFLVQQQKGQRTKEISIKAQPPTVEAGATYESRWVYGGREARS